MIKTSCVATFSYWACQVCYAAPFLFTITTYEIRSLKLQWDFLWPCKLHPLQPGHCSHTTGCWRRLLLDAAKLPFSLPWVHFNSCSFLWSPSSCAQVLLKTIHTLSITCSSLPPFASHLPDTPLKTLLVACSALPYAWQTSHVPALSPSDLTPCSVPWQFHPPHDINGL